MIDEKIKKDVDEEFANLKKELQIHLKGDFDVSQTRAFLKTHIPNEITYKSEVLLDTLLNYLMEDARKQIESADATLQNAFYDADFRKRIHKWTKQLGNNLSLETDIVKYSIDPRLKQGLIASGIIFVAGAGVTTALLPTVVGSMVAGLVTIVLSALAFKFSFDKATPKSREIIKKDIDQYLEGAQIQMLSWLISVEKAFNNDFRQFCLDNGFESGVIING